MDLLETSIHDSAPDEDVTRSLDDDSIVDELLIPTDALHSSREFQTLPTHFPAALLSVLHVVYVILSVLVAIMCILKDDGEQQCYRVLGSIGGDGAILLGKVVLWGFVLFFTIYIKYHHRKARRRGYLQFYRRMQEVIHLPLIYHSGGNAFLLWVMGSKADPKNGAYFMLTVVVAELLMALPCLVSYTVKVVQFNREKAAADVTREEHSLNVTSPPRETGFRDGSNLAEVVEKQADLIEYLKQYNTLLSRRLLDLTGRR